MIAYHHNYFSGNIPVHWDNSFKDLSYAPGRITNPETEREWQLQGHNYECLVINGYHYPNPMPSWLEQAYSNWPWKSFSTSFHRIDPGKYYPLHKDYYPKYSGALNVDPADIVRLVLFLEDRKSGHFLEVGDSVIHNWKAGDFVGWYGDVPHLTANLGSEPRYAAIITGHK